MADAPVRKKVEKIEKKGLYSYTPKFTDPSGKVKSEYDYPKFIQEAYAKSKPYYNQPQADMVNRLGKFTAYDNVLRAIVDGFGASKGVRVERNNSSPVPYFTEYNNMMSQYQDQLNQHNMSYAKDRMTATDALFRGQMADQEMGLKTENAYDEANNRRELTNNALYGADMDAWRATQQVKQGEEGLAEQVRSNKANEGIRRMSESNQAQMIPAEIELKKAQTKYYDDGRPTASSKGLKPQQDYPISIKGSITNLKGETVAGVYQQAFNDTKFREEFGSETGLYAGDLNEALQNETVQAAFVSRYMSQMDDATLKKYLESDRQGRLKGLAPVEGSTAPKSSGWFKTEQK